MMHKLYGRLDAGLQTTMEGTVRLFLHEKEEGEDDRRSAGSAMRKYYYPRQAIAVFDHDGGLLKEQSLGNLHAFLPASIALDKDGLQFHTLHGSQMGADGGLRTVVQRIRTSPQSAVFIAICQPMEDASGDLELLGGILCLAIPFTMILTAAGGWFLARKSLAPVVVMSECARRIGAKNLSERLPVINPHDELGNLATTFNELLARLHRALMQQRQFMADASHELRNPVSVIRTTSEVMMGRVERGVSEYREALARIGDQARRVTRIIEDMFTLARADAGGRELKPQDFYLDELVTEAARAAGALAERKGVNIECAPALETLYRGDEELLRQMLLNLLDNAIKYTPEEGKISLRLVQGDSSHIITIADTGVGIPIEARPHIFERFYRADKARSRVGEANGVGVGLGLSIAKWITEAHGGRLTLQHSDSDGSVFVVSLPAHGITRQLDQ